MIALCALPGLDGTARLLAPFADAARAAGFERVDTLGYPRDRPLDYAALESLARAALPSREDFVLLGESFSGPIALSIAAKPPPNLIGVALSTSFARAPVPALAPLAGLARYAPVRSLPMPILSWWLLGRRGTTALRRALNEALSDVSPRVLRARAAYAMRADVADLLPRIAVPILYLRATGDRLLRPAAARDILAAAPDARRVDVDGPHLLLQTAPAICAQHLAAFARDVYGKARPPVSV